MGSTTTYTKAPSCTGAFAVRGHEAVVEAFLEAGVMAGTAAPIGGTGLPVGAELRLRPAGVPMTVRPVDATGGDIQLNSDTPGDLPPRDPLT